MPGTGPQAVRHGRQHRALFLAPHALSPHLDAPLDWVTEFESNPDALAGRR